MENSKYLKLEDIFKDFNKYFGKNPYLKQISNKSYRVVLGSYWNESLLESDLEIELNSEKLKELGLMVRSKEKFTFKCESPKYPNISVDIIV